MGCVFFTNKVHSNQIEMNLCVDESVWHKLWKWAEFLVFVSNVCVCEFFLLFPLLFLSVSFLIIINIIIFTIICTLIPHWNEWKLLCVFVCHGIHSVEIFVLDVSLIVNSMWVFLRAWYCSMNNTCCLLLFIRWFWVICYCYKIIRFSTAHLCAHCAKSWFA